MRIFAYGTLKRGERNARLCGDDALRRPATVSGRLYLHPAGHPVLVVPAELVLARGSADVARDAALGRAAQDARAGIGRRPEHGGRSLPAPEVEGWTRIEGELVALADAASRLPALDALEGLVPGRPAGDYERVLLPVRTPGGVAAAWAWVAPGGRVDASWVALPGPRWPAATRDGRAGMIARGGSA